MIILVIILLSQVDVTLGQAAQTGIYRGYRQSKVCDPAGGVGENERIKATLNFALCCRATYGVGEQCCQNCIKQFSDYFDYSFPCWSKQGGGVMQEKTEGAMVENNFVWDVTRYKWTCSSLKDKPTWLSALAVAAMIMYLFN